MTVSNGKTPTGLDEAVRMFAGYVRGENGFDELDFKEWLIEWREQEIADTLEDFAKYCHTRYKGCTMDEYAYDGEVGTMAEDYLRLKGETK